MKRYVVRSKAVRHGWIGQIIEYNDGGRNEALIFWVGPVVQSRTRAITQAATEADEQNLEVETVEFVE